MKLFGWEFAWSYTLHEDLVRDTPVKAPGAFSNPWLKITPTAAGSRLIVFRGYADDGCTGIPDPPNSKQGSTLHDAVYQFAEDIAAATGCTVMEVLQYGDAVFDHVLRSDGCPVAGILSRVVGVVGAPYHYARRWVRSLFV